MAADVVDALLTEQGDALGVEDELLELMADAVVGGLDIDDGTELGFAEDGVVFGLATANADDALGHGQQGIHGGGVAVELVENGIAAVHESLVFGKGYALDLDELHLVGMGLEHILGGTEHDVGAFVGAAASAEADEDFGEG